MASKNQRSGPKVEQKKSFCKQGHELVPVMVVPGFKGRAGMQRLCQCAGFYPINVNSKA